MNAISGAVAEAYALERTLSRVYRSEPWLVDEIALTASVRLSRQGRRAGAEPVLEALFSGMNYALRHDPEMAEMMLKFDTAFARAIRPQANHSVAVLALEEQRLHWQSIRKALLAKDRAVAEDLVAWVDRDIAERMDIVRKLRSGKATTAARSAAGSEATSTAVEKALTAAERKAVAEAARRAEGAREVYEAFVAAAARSKPDDFPAFNRLAAYLPRDDPLWERIAEKVASHRANQKMEDIANAIQGVIGEALALRNAWVVDSIVKAAERAQGIVKDLGKSWKVVLVQTPVFATKKAGGIGEIYDASIWIVKIGETAKGELLDAAPVFVLQVKSGSTREAVEQIGKDFRREIIGEVRLPVAAGAGVGAVRESATKTYRINNLRKLLADNGVKEAPGSVGSLTTQRMLVAPRPPSEGAIIRNLPSGTAIEYVEGLMTKGDLNTISGAMRDALKKK